MIGRAASHAGNRALKALRRFWHRQIRRYQGELCHDCGRRYDGTIWNAPNHLWNRLTNRGRAGLLCPTCFSDRAAAQGMLLIWEPRWDA